MLLVKPLTVRQGFCAIVLEDQEQLVTNTDSETCMFFIFWCISNVVCIHPVSQKTVGHSTLAHNFAIC